MSNGGGMSDGGTVLYHRLMLRCILKLALHELLRQYSELILCTAVEPHFQYHALICELAA